MNDNRKPEAFYLRFILISAVVCVCTLMASSYYSTTDNTLLEAWSETTDGNEVSADADGYLNGKWNFWEAVGDFFSGIIE